MMTPGVVCFDWGGVILRICRGWGEAVRAAGLPLHDETARPETTARRRDVAHRFQIGAIGRDRFAEELSVAVDGRYTRAEVLRIHDAWLLREYDGVSELIDRLHAAAPGVRTALLSNTNESHFERDRDFPTVRKLHARYASHLMGAAKPEEAIFRMFESACGSSGAEILFFDDTAENIDAARARGWQAELIDHAGDTAEQMAAALRSRGIGV